MRPSQKTIVVLLTTATLAAPAVHAQGFLDRIRQRAEEATDSIRDVRDGVEDITNADERAVAEAEAAQRGVQRDVESATDVEGQARRAASETELGRTAREAELEAARIATTDERLAGQAVREAAAVERDVRNATDVEGRAEQAVRTSEPGRAVAQTEREIERIEQTDERVQATAERRVDDALGVSDAQRSVNQTERAVRDTQRAVDDLESALE